ncbi:MAG TPA: hypothetical protein VJA16_18200, partial [Thermoanaerobaculia bacterium]
LKNLMRSAGTDIRGKTQRLIAHGGGSGRYYAGGGGARYRGQYRAQGYYASAPLQPPVTVSGTLRASLRSYSYPSGDGFAVRARAFYGLFLAAGASGGGRTRGGVRRRGQHQARVLQPRPYLDQVMHDEQSQLEQRVRTALTQGLTWKDTKGV